MRKRTLSAAVLICTLAFTASAGAAPPLKRLVWAKATAAYTAQAKAHGAAAVCTPWSSSGIEPMSCDFGDAGRVLVTYTTSPCRYSLLVSRPRGGGLPANFMRSEKAVLNYCAAGWWQKPLPAPWLPATG